MMITIHQRNQKFPMTMTLSTNILKIHFLEYCQTNISLTSSQFSSISSLLILLSLFLPSMNIPLFEKCNVLLSLMSNNSPMNRFSMLNSSWCQNPVLSISLFSAESGQTSYRKVPCFANKVLEWYKHLFQIPNSPWWQDQNYSSANYIHCSAKLSVNVHNSL